LRRIRGGFWLAADNACRGEAYAVRSEDGWRMAFAARDPCTRFVIEAHIGGGGDPALCRDPNEVTANDLGRAVDEDSCYTSGDEFVVALADLFGDDGGATEREGDDS